MAKRFIFRKLREEAQSIWDDSVLRSQTPLTRLQKFAHFWALVWKSFTRNRCPVRASALAYVTLLALVPMLAVVVSVTSTFLKSEGEDQIDAFIVRFVSSVVPPATLNPTAADSEEPVEPGTNATAVTQGADTNNLAQIPGKSSQTNAASLASLATDERAVKVRKDVAKRIHEFIQNTRSGTLGVTGSVLLIFAAISMLTRIEETFNDIWGVARVKLKGDEQIDIRCAIADFAVQDGLMNTNAFVFDTKVVNIEGTGSVNLKTEQLDLKLNPQDFVVFPIAESSKILPLSVSCSKSELGKSVLAAVDRVVADKNAQREFDSFYRAWLDEDTAAYYERQLKQVRGPR